VEVEVLNPDTPFTRACARGSRLSIPVKHTTGRYYAPEPELDRLEADGRVLVRYAPGQNPNGAARDIAGVCNAEGNVMGLMPHPEHAVDRLTGSADGGALFASLVAHVGEPVATA
jgi:phosphoribosylformylglycinamidine synthase